MRRTDFLCPLKIQRVKGGVSVPEMPEISFLTRFSENFT